VLVQPVYKDNSLGPVLHVVVKPNGSNWVERKLDPKLNADPWVAFENTGTRYAARVAADGWTGELAVPWPLLADAKRGMPTLLRFNFSQHRPAAGESASWAGPVDFGRDDALTGLLHLKLPLPGQAGDAVRGDGGGRRPGDDRAVRGRDADCGLRIFPAPKGGSTIAGGAAPGEEHGKHKAPKGRKSRFAPRKRPALSPLRGFRVGPIIQPGARAPGYGAFAPSGLENPQSASASAIRNPQFPPSRCPPPLHRFQCRLTHGHRPNV
jgi:hypothetical protein